MIRQGLVTYLNLQLIDSSVNGKVYYQRTPPDKVMPWILVTSSGGTRTNLSEKYQNIDDTIYLHVDTPNLFTGKTIADKLVSLLDNYRGDMSPATDVYLQCNTPQEQDGPNGSFRFTIQMRAQYKIVRTGFV